MKATITAQEVFVRLGKERAYYFNLINFVLLERCRGGYAEPITKIITRYADQSGNERLKASLDKALSESCPDESPADPHRIDEGEPLPPPPDGEGGEGSDN